MSDISNLSNIFNFNTYQEILNAITSINIHFDWNIMNTKQPINTNLNSFTASPSNTAPSKVESS